MEPKDSNGGVQNQTKQSAKSGLFLGECATE